jgi:chromosome segregation ATPase
MKNTTLVLTLVLLSSMAFAKTNVSEKVEQLKDNSENSKINLAQYEENLKVVEQNLRDTDKAIHQLAEQKVALKKQIGESAKGAGGIDASKKQVNSYILSETQKLELEKKQIAELKKTLEQLEANQVKREENIAAYREKMKSVDSESASLAERNQSIQELGKSIEEKQNQAFADRQKLMEKKATYEQEIAKWKKEVRVSEREYANYKNLKD